MACMHSCMHVVCMYVIFWLRTAYILRDGRFLSTWFMRSSALHFKVVVPIVIDLARAGIHAFGGTASGILEIVSVLVVGFTRHFAHGAFIFKNPASFKLVIAQFRDQRPAS